MPRRAGACRQRGAGHGRLVERQVQPVTWRAGAGRQRGAGRGRAHPGRQDGRRHQLQVQREARGGEEVDLRARRRPG